MNYNSLHNGTKQTGWENKVKVKLKRGTQILEQRQNNNVYTFMYPS